jgi:hypothetical protein
MMDIAKNMMTDGCPVDLSKEFELHQRLEKFLAAIGQADGYWTERGQKLIPQTFKSGIPLAMELDAKYKDGYRVAVTEKFAAQFSNPTEGGLSAHDIFFMSRTYYVEFSVGWRISCVLVGKRSVWFVTGLPWPREGDALVVFATLDEILGLDQNLALAA